MVFIDQLVLWVGWLVNKILLVIILNVDVMLKAQKEIFIYQKIQKNIYLREMKLLQIYMVKVLLICMTDINL